MSTYQLQKDFDSQLSLSSSRSTDRKYSKEKGIPSSYQHDHSPYMRSHDSIHQSHDPVSTSHDSARSPDHRISESRSNQYSFKDTERLSDSPTYSPYSTSTSQPNYPYSGPAHKDMSTSSSSPRFEVRVSPLNTKTSYRDSPERTSPAARRGYSPERGYQGTDGAYTKTRYGVDLSPRHSPSPYQERSLERPTATQTYYYSDERSTPEPAESRLVFSGPLPNQFNFAQSRPAGSSPTSSPRNSGFKSNYNDLSRSENNSGQYSPKPQFQSPTHSSTGEYRDSVSNISQQPIRSPAHSNQPIKSPPSKPQPMKEGGTQMHEAEVDALTNLLMQNMEAAADPEFFGQCADCGKAIVGESNACLAMDQMFHVECFSCVECGMCAKCARAIMGEDTGCKALDEIYHVDCFSCTSCSVGLKGSHFYAMEGKLYCESCYVNTLEKCSVCSEPITDKIVRATGKPYHSQCFVCVVCKQNMEGVPFTVDSANQVHCIQDFHRKFAPRCCVCDLPIMPQEGEEEAVRIVALDRSFHMACYKCEDCGVVLSSETEGKGCYPLDEHILCKTCNAHRIQKLTSKMTTEL